MSVILNSIDSIKYYLTANQSTKYEHLDDWLLKYVSIFTVFYQQLEEIVSAL